MLKIKVITLMALFLFLAALLLGLFWLLERATRPEALRPGIFVEVPR
jgi:hypothetical protein